MTISLIWAKNGPDKRDCEVTEYIGDISVVCWSARETGNSTRGQGCSVDRSLNTIHKVITYPESCLDIL